MAGASGGGQAKSSNRKAAASRTKRLKVVKSQKPKKGKAKKR